MLKKTSLSHFHLSGGKHFYEYQLRPESQTFLAHFETDKVRAISTKCAYSQRYKKRVRNKGKSFLSQFEDFTVSYCRVRKI
jgi:hypothetical protein